MAGTGSGVVTRLGVEIAASVPDDFTPLRISRLGVELAAKYPGRDVLVGARVSRLGVEVAAQTEDELKFLLTRLGVEVAAESPEAKLLLSRLGVEISAEVDKPPFRITRLGVEVSAPRPGEVVEEDEPVVLPFYVHNWAHKVEMETSFQTDVSQDPELGARERRSRLSKPVRILSPHWNPTIGLGARELLWDLMRLGNDRLLIPLYQDKTPVTATSSGTFLFCNPRLRRMFAGARVIIFKKNSTAGTISGVQSRVIATIADLGIHLTQALSGSPSPLDWWVVPAMYCEASLEEISEWITDGVADFAPNFVEAQGRTALRMSEDGESSGYFPTHLGYAVFPLDVNWASPPKLGMRRQGESQEQGKGTATTLLGARPELVQESQIDCRDRAESWSVLTFLESRRGRTRPFWLPLALPLVSPSKIVSITATEIEITEYARVLNLQDFLQGIAIRTKDGGLAISRVDSVAQGIGVVTISLLDPLPVGSGEALEGLIPSEISKLVPCSLFCLASDSFTESWSTDTVCSFSFLCTELPFEIDVTTPSLAEEYSHVEPVSLIWILNHDPVTL